jgi:tetraacyldisaccharide 4'-kinase
MRAPEFWRQEGGLAGRLLAPAGCALAHAGRLRRYAARPTILPVPVICIGNLVAGGAGKTPVALAVGQYLRARGANPHFLLRGYGGRLPGPVQVDPQRHSARDVGDEALLLAAAGPSWVARDRAAGGLAALRDGAGIVVMDDGFQNPGLFQDLSLLVVDGAYGFGNGRVMPAGPLREPIADGLDRADAVVVMGPDRAGISATVAKTAEIPILGASLTPTPAAEALAGCRIIAFAGIGRPEKFFDSLAALPCTLVATHPFPDHHRYTDDELAALRRDAAGSDALLVTTAKDAARLGPAAMAGIQTLSVAVSWSEPARLTALLAAVADKAGAKQ